MNLQRLLRYELNEGVTGHAFEQPIHRLIEAQAEQTPEAIAVSFGEIRLSYRELNQQANQLARTLQQMGVGPEVVVGLYLERSPEMIVGLLAVLKAGGAYTPLDPAYPKERLAFILADSGASILLTQDRLAGMLSEFSGGVVRLDRDWPVIAQRRDENLADQVELDHLAYIIYTSGSTGQPKGVMISHRALLNFTLAARSEYDLSARDKVLQFASISFDTAVEEIYPCLTCGARLILRTELGSISSFLQHCRAWAITFLSLPTAYWHQLVAALAAENLALPHTLRLVVIGGEKALPQPLQLWRQRVGDQVGLLNTYGPTETTVVATSCDLNGSALRLGGEGLPVVPIGSALPTIQTYVLDQDLQPVAAGSVGELYLGGTTLARGYLNQPDLTAETFIPHPFSDTPGARLYKTGDLVRYLPDGQLEFAGRRDEQVKVRGFRVELAEIEAALQRHPAVRQAVVLAWQTDQPAGDTRLAAYIVLNDPAATSLELRRFLMEKLPHYMVPAHFILLEAFPLTPSGKIDRRALAAPPATRPEISTPFVAPRTATEETLAKLWTETLGLKQVGVYDNFIELGGHSLLAAQLISRVRTIFQVELSPSHLFEVATIAGVAQHIEVIQWAQQQLELFPAVRGQEREGRDHRDEGEL
jgi:amino acid adenylation domain-containing protein